MDKHQVNTTTKKPLMVLSVIAAIVALLGILLMVMPKGFSTTHEEIGRGKPAVVFVYDPNLTVSHSQTEQMNEARAHLGDNVVFLLARVGDPNGAKLIAKYRAQSSELLLFDPAGHLTKRQYGVINANELMLWLR
ncbi:MAG: hypothetical protein ACRCWP_11620 [Shewanella sp.]